MDFLSLYEEDLSLFSGDLLVGLSPATVESGFSQDGLKTSSLASEECQPGIALLGQHGLGLEQSNMGKCS